MDKQKIKQLRDKLSIPLDTAIKLLRKNNGNVIACEQEFYNDTIKEISKVSECDEETAKENYQLYNYDKIKAIDRINSKQEIITTMKNHIQRNEIGFILWPENNDGEKYETTKRNDVFIPASDFDYIISEFKSVFPIEISPKKIIEESFENCGNNYFDNKTCKQIVEKLSRIKVNEKNVEQFL